jgi:putative hydrolase of the HAD superfamily
MMLKAVTFDCWDTLLIDDHCCESKQEEYLQAVLQKKGFQLNLDDLNDAFQLEDKLRREYVVKHRKTKSAMQRLETVLELLEISLPLSEMAAAADYCDKIALEFRPSVVPKVREALATLARDYRLAVICNTGWHSAETIKDLLAGHDLSNFFDCFSFSDEIGVAKPHPRIFEMTLEGLGSHPEEAVHIGDAEYSDVAGAKGVNMRTILYTGCNDTYRENNSADFMIDDYDDLLSLIRDM